MDLVAHASGRVSSESVVRCRDSEHRPAHAPIPPPQHPTFDLKRVRACAAPAQGNAIWRLFAVSCEPVQCVLTALEEDSAGLGDVTTLSTCATAPSKPAQGAGGLVLQRATLTV
jgi:hypothetical protein